MHGYVKAATGTDQARPKPKQVDDRKTGKERGTLTGTDGTNGMDGTDGRVSGEGVGSPVVSIGKAPSSFLQVQVWQV